VIVHCAEVEAKCHTNHSCNDTNTLHDAVNLEALEETEEDGTEREDDGEGREQDGGVRWSHFVAIALRIAIGFSIRRSRESSTTGYGSFVRRRLSHVREERAIRIVALDVRTFGCARYGAVSGSPGVQEGLLLVGNIELAVAVAERGDVLAVDVGRIVACVGCVFDAVVIPSTISQRTVDFSAVAGLDMIV
jgi:hypothetical protein